MQRRDKHILCNDVVVIGIFTALTLAWSLIVLTIMGVVLW